MAHTVQDSCAAQNVCYLYDSRRASSRIQDAIASPDPHANSGGPQRSSFKYHVDKAQVISVMLPPCVSPLQDLGVQRPSTSLVNSALSD